MLLPFAKVYLSTCGLMFRRVTPFVVLRRSTWISLSKWPMLQTMAWSFIAAMCSKVITSQLPVVVT